MSDIVLFGSRPLVVTRIRCVKYERYGIFAYVHAAVVSDYVVHIACNNVRYLRRSRIILARRYRYRVELSVTVNGYPQQAGEYVATAAVPSGITLVIGYLPASGSVIDVIGQINPI